jgi:hypothetical protein
MMRWMDGFDRMMCQKTLIPVMRSLTTHVFPIPTIPKLFLSISVDFLLSIPVDFCRAIHIVLSPFIKPYNGSVCL